MAQLPLKVTSADEDHLTLQISKTNFSEFVSSLLSTPREERRKIYDGFDLSLLELKSLVEKIHHKINTDHDVMNISFGAVVYNKDESEVASHDYDQFFSTTDSRSVDVDRVSVTISAVIGLNRFGGEKHFEKQIISFSFYAGAPGRIETEIRSTEISWPAGYFIIVENHVKALRSKLQRSDYDSLKWILYPSNTFYRTSEKRSDDTPASPEQKRRLAFLVVQILAMSVVLVFILANISDMTSSFIINPDSLLLEKVDASQLVSEVGVDSAVSALSDARTIRLAEGLGYAAGSEPRGAFGNLTDTLFTKLSLIVFFIVASYVLTCWLYARHQETNRLGRIFLHRGDILPRKSENHIFGILTSIFLGIWASILAAALLEFIGMAA
jgi:hypothetical protein